MRDQVWWYIARSGGIVALTLSGLSVVWGLLLSTKLLDGRPGPRWLLDLHRFLGGATVVFTGIHVLGLMLDSYIGFSIVEVLVPFASAWNPAAVAWGVIAFWLLLAVQISSMLMNRIPRRWWTLIHLTSYGLFWAGLVHGAAAGTDASNPLYIIGFSMLILATLFLTAYRILAVRRRPRLAALPSS